MADPHACPDAPQAKVTVDMTCLYVCILCNIDRYLVGCAWQARTVGLFPMPACSTLMPIGAWDSELSFSESKVSYPADCRLSCCCQHTCQGVWLVVVGSRRNKSNKLELFSYPLFTLVLAYHAADVVDDDTSTVGCETLCARPLCTFGILLDCPVILSTTQPS